MLRPTFTSPSLRLRVSLVLTALAAFLVCIGAGYWLSGSRAAIHEEIEAASRVAVQWLSVAARGAREGDPAWSEERLIEHLRAVGRVRANAIEVRDAFGSVRYRSPGPRYKAGRAAPAWFSAWLTPDLAPRSLAAGQFTVHVLPDASRSVLDAWDDLVAFAGWTALTLVGLFLACWLALDRALKPLGAVMAALDRLGHGRFDTRLPVFDSRELGRLARAFNGMADRLDAAVIENVRLAHDRELGQAVQARLEEDRKAVARELHDELGQSITAVRSLAGAIAQRSADRPEIGQSAAMIVDVAGEMHQGVRGILQRLRAAGEGRGLDASVSAWLAAWRSRHPGIVLEEQLASGTMQVCDDTALAALRIVQESLTNIARHSGATQASVTLAGSAGWLEIAIADNGRGLAATPTEGYGLTGMRERVAALSGEFTLDTTPGAGTLIRARLPAMQPEYTPC